MTAPDLKDYLARIALGLEALGQPHVWDRDLLRSDATWRCKWCGVAYAHERRDESCQTAPRVARLNG